ncbi:MAG: glutamine--tRNA ligase/YqeY domain fusion protein [Ruminococcaceae bacterium]|nr:glutamine--tRNA ligase/YqeY domain fusion protein [Oscillospiraceae bacterium]
MENIEKTTNEEVLFEGNFIHDFIDEDLREGNFDRVQTRFPPEPNGYLHVGHIKAIAVDFTTAKKYNGICNLRLDDTNPQKEDDEYVNAIIEDIRWLGFEPDNILYGSNYFDDCYEAAVRLIKKGKAFVCDLSAEQMREYRGSLTEPGKESPYHNRTVEENLDLFERMRKGEFEPGEKTLRAKIDMSSGNLNMRDPIIYRIMKVPHDRCGDKWCIYPMYDFNHPISDTVEGVTHSLCTLEFEDHRPLYDWVLKEAEFEKPSRQIEFARLNLSYALTSKRRCLALVNGGAVTGWDDPRMATIAGMRRRGYPAPALLDFVSKAGLSKTYSVVDYSLLEFCVRDYLNTNAERAMAVLKPLKVVIENYPEGKTEEVSVEINPNKPELGSRKVTFSRELYIEADDFTEVPPKGYHRLSPGKEVRLKGGYYITAQKAVYNENGDIDHLICTYDPETAGGTSPDGRKVKGTIHWVDANNCVDAEVRLYDRLFKNPNPSDGEVFDNLNPDSLTVVENAKVEKYLHGHAPLDTFQFLRHGYFTVDKDSTEEKMVFNRTVTLKDSWAKQK